MRTKLALALGALTLALAPMANAQTNISSLTGGLNTFVNDATASLPFASAAGLDWSDAYIGNLVAVPPHFGLGLTVGATTIPGKAVKPLVEALGGSLGMADVPLPLAAVNARIGGVLLPFDVGLKVGTVPGGVTVGDYKVSYQNYGLDVRYALFQGEPLLPTVSLGAGVDYFAAGLEATYGSAVNYASGGNTLNISAPKANLDLSSLTFEAKAQVSKSLLILTPYLGVSALLGSSTAKAGIHSTITPGAEGLAYWQAFVPNLSAAGFSQEKSTSGFGLKVFGGASVNLVVFHFDLQGLYNLFDGAYGATVGARFQL